MRQAQSVLPDIDRLSAKVGDLDLEKQNLTKLRDRVLAEMKLGKQALCYKAAQKALDSFVLQLGG